MILALALGLVLLSSQAHAQAPNWISFTDEDVIEVLTHDPDGALRETKVWVGVLDGVGYAPATRAGAATSPRTRT